MYHPDKKIEAALTAFETSLISGHLPDFIDKWDGVKEVLSPHMCYPNDENLDAALHQLSVLLNYMATSANVGRACDLASLIAELPSPTSKIILSAFDLVKQAVTRIDGSSPFEGEKTFRSQFVEIKGRLDEIHDEVISNECTLRNMADELAGRPSITVVGGANSVDTNDQSTLDQFCNNLSLDDKTKKALAKHDVVDLIAIETTLGILLSGKLDAASHLELGEARETLGAMLARGDVERVNQGLDDLMRSRGPSDLSQLRSGLPSILMACIA